MSWLRLSLFIAAVLFTLGTDLPRASASTTLTPSSEPIPRTYFGLHIHRAGKNTSWPPIPFGAWRLWDAGVPWAKLEPAKGQFDFTTLDREVDLAQQHRVELLMTFGKTPTWAAARPSERTGRRAAVAGGASEPIDLTDWRTFVRAVVTRYKGRIQAYELWNEPNLPAFYTGSPEAMVDMARDAYSTIKQLDPDALVVSPSPVGPAGVSWLDAFLSAGGSKYVDVIGYHFYVRKKPPEAMVDRAREVAEVMRRNGVADKPLWNTETGRQTWGGPRLPDDSPEAVAYVARSYIVNWAAGVRRFYWYAWDDSDMGIRMTSGDENTPTAAAHAYTAIESWLAGASMKACSNNGSTWTCEIRRDEASSWLVWNTDGNSQFTPPRSWAAVSVQRLQGSREQLRAGQKVSIEAIPSLFETSVR